MGLENIACCYHTLTAYLIQYLLLGIVGVGLIFHIIGFILMLWQYISGFIEFLYVMCFIFNLFSGLSILLLIYYRHRKVINNTKNKISIRISFINIIIIIIAIIFGSICLVYCSVKYYDHDAEIIEGKRAVTGWDKFFMFLTLGLNIRFFLFLFFFWVSILIRLLKKTSGAYKNQRNSEINISTISNMSNEGGDNNNKIQVQSGNNNITKEVKVMYGVRELNLK